MKNHAGHLQGNDKKQIKSYLGDKSLSALSMQEIQEFYNAVKKHSRVRLEKLHRTELVDSLLRKTYRMLHEALDMAVAKWLLFGYHK